MEVAAALLDASRKLSTGNISNSDVSTCSSNNTETTMAWLGGWPIQKKLSTAGLTPNNTPSLSPGFLTPDRHRIRRSSSKDVEEAMAGGLGKADMYMPPM